MVALVALLALSFTACGDGDDDGSLAGGIVVSDAWARPAQLLGDDMGDMEHEGTAEEDGMEMGGTNGAVYMTIENEGDEDDRLVGVQSEIADAVELHTVNMVEGVMQMRPVEDGIEIPAGGSETVVLEPGGLHVMLVGLNESLAVGDTFVVELEFEQAGSIAVDVEVREP